MSQMISIGTMIKRIEGLLGTNEVSDWEGCFISSVIEKTNCGNDTAHLSDKQVEIIERIHNKHFA